MFFFTCSAGSPNYHFPSSKVLIFLVWRDSHGTVSKSVCIFSTAGKFFGGRCGSGRFGTEIHMEFQKNGEKVLGTFCAAFSCCWVWIPLSLFATHHEKWPQNETLNSNSQVLGNLPKKKLIQLSPCFCPWFFSLRIYHFWTAPVIEFMHRHRGTCIKISHLQFLDTTTGQIVVVISIWRHPGWTQRQAGVFLKRLKVI